MFRISTVAFALLFLTKLFVRGDCRPQLPLPVGQTLGGATGPLTGAAAGLPLAGGMAQDVLSPVGNVPQRLPVVGGVLAG